MIQIKFQFPTSPHCALMSWLKKKSTCKKSTWMPSQLVKFAPHLLLLSNAASHPRYVIVPTRKLFWWVHKAPISFSIQISEAKTGKAMGLQLLSLSLVILIFCSCDTSGRDIFLNTIGGQRPRTTGSIGGQTNRYSIPFSSF